MQINVQKPEKGDCRNQNFSKKIIFSVSVLKYTCSGFRLIKYDLKMSQKRNLSKYMTCHGNCWQTWFRKNITKYSRCRWNCKECVRICGIGLKNRQYWMSNRGTSDTCYHSNWWSIYQINSSSKQNKHCYSVAKAIHLVNRMESSSQKVRNRFNQDGLCEHRPKLYNP